MTEEKSKRRQEMVGKVVSDKMQKTRVIELSHKRKHHLYRKSLIKKRRLFIHDEKNESKIGDVVLVESTRPLSRHKHFSLRKILVTKPVEEVGI